MKEQKAAQKQIPVQNNLSKSVQIPTGIIQQANKNLRQEIVQSAKNLAVQSDKEEYKEPKKDFIKIKSIQED